MTELAGHVTAEVVTASYRGLAAAVNEARLNDYENRDSYFIRRDFDHVLEAAAELLAVIEEHVHPRCEVVGGLGRCILPEHTDRTAHHSGIIRWY